MLKSEKIFIKKTKYTTWFFTFFLIFFYSNPAKSQSIFDEITITGDECSKASEPNFNNPPESTWENYLVTFTPSNFDIDLCSCSSIIFSVLDDNDIPQGDIRVNTNSPIDFGILGDNFNAVTGITLPNPNNNLPNNVSNAGYAILPQNNCSLTLFDDGFNAPYDYRTDARHSVTPEGNTIYSISVRWYHFPNKPDYKRVLKAGVKCKGSVKFKQKLLGEGKIIWDLKKEAKKEVYVYPRKPNNITATKLNCTQWILNTSIPGLADCPGGFPDARIEYQRLQNGTWIPFATTPWGQTSAFVEYNWVWAHGFSVPVRAVMLVADANPGPVNTEASSLPSNVISLNVDEAVTLDGPSEIPNGASAWWGLIGGSVSSATFTIGFESNVSATITSQSSFTGVQAAATIDVQGASYGVFEIRATGTLTCGTPFTRSKIITVKSLGLEPNEPEERTSLNDEVQNQTKINFAEGNLSITTNEEGPKRLLIYQVDGKVVLDREYNENVFNVELLPNKLSNNLYFITVSSAEGTVTRKVFINN